MLITLALFYRLCDANKPNKIIEKGINVRFEIIITIYKQNIQSNLYINLSFHNGYIVTFDEWIKVPY